jgi:tetratricopeptide (TPR) repeat protein
VELAEPQPALPTSPRGLAPNSAPRPPAEAASAPATEAKCREWSAAGRTEKAIDCFRSVARGTGLEGEVALYEAARLTADGLHDPSRALGLLAEYDKRFTGGAMRGEAAWLRIRAQRDAGRFDEALAGSEALLASPEGRALASELHWLRGQIYQENRHDCASAVSELVALVGEPGERGDAAEVRRARCLEQLGRTDDAVAAYERYLARPEPRRASEAKSRLSALHP